MIAGFAVTGFAIADLGVGFAVVGLGVGLTAVLFGFTVTFDVAMGFAFVGGRAAFLGAAAL